MKESGPSGSVVTKLGNKVGKSSWDGLICRDLWQWLFDPGPYSIGIEEQHTKVQFGLYNCMYLRSGGQGLVHYTSPQFKFKLTAPYSFPYLKQSALNHFVQSLL